MVARESAYKLIGIAVSAFVAFVLAFVLAFAFGSSEAQASPETATATSVHDTATSALQEAQAAANGAHGYARAQGTDLQTAQRAAGDTHGYARTQGANLQEVQAAANEARDYARVQGFKALAFKDVFEAMLEGARCYSVADGAYLIAYGDACYRCVNGVVAEAPSAEVPASFATLAQANAAAEKPAACITRGLNAEGDGGHGYYVRGAEGAWQLASAEGAVNVFQLGYTEGQSVNPAIDAFHASGFHTLVFPEGTYPVDKSIWARFDNRAYYGLGATLQAGAVQNTDGSITEGVLLSVRGNIVWGTPINAYYTTSHQEYNGLTFTKPADLASPGWSNMVRVRNANDISFTHCSFIDEGRNVLCLDLYGNYDGVTIDDVTCIGNGDVQIRDLCNNVDRLQGDTFSHVGTTGGGRNVVLRNCTFTMGNSVEEGLPLFAGNQQGLGYYKDGVFHEYDILKNCLVENVTLENNTWTMEEPTPEAIERRNTSRIVAFTCGYEDSPVRNVTVRNNTFDVFANYCFAQFGYVDGVEFAGNRVRIWGDFSGDAGSEKWADIFERDSFSRAGPTSNVSIHDNVFTLEGPAGVQGARTLTRLIDHKFKAGEITFANNEVTTAGGTTQLHDSTVSCAGNAFHLRDVKSLYSDVRDVRDNTYEIGELGNLYEADGANVQADVCISGERATIASMPDKAHLMSFNNQPAYNGHAISFYRCAYDIASAPYKWRRIAYGTSGIKDETTLRLTSCSIAGFSAAPYNAIDKNESGKVKLVIDSEIEYDLAGGSLAQANPSAYTELDSFTLANPTRAGYTFAGWTGTGLEQPSTRVVVPEGSTGDRSYQAHWKRNDYSIRYDLGGGAVAPPNPGGYHVETATFTLANPTRAGYTFAGWTGTGLEQPSTRVVVPEGSTGDRSYTATWTELPDMLGQFAVTTRVSKGKATITGLISPVAGALGISTVVDNPAGIMRYVAAIGKGAFAKSGVSSVTLGPSVQSIGAGAFAHAANLKSVKIGKNVKTVGSAAFQGSKKLKTLTVYSAKLTKASCKKMLKGSKVKTVKLAGMKKAQKTKVLKKYGKWFPKKVGGKKLIVR